VSNLDKEQWLYETHASNSVFVLKTLFIFLGGGLLATSNFVAKLLVASFDENSHVSVISDLLIFVGYSYLAFIIGLFFSLLAALCTYFSNRMYLEGKPNCCIVSFSIFFGIIGLVCLIAGLSLLVPAFRIPAYLH
jgi:hypothetical protein